MYSAKTIWEVLIAFDVLMNALAVAYVHGRGGRPITKSYGLGHYIYMTIAMIVVLAIIAFWTV